ncbi:P-loop containing nucleoside triphosphate hydrolase protein [Rhexocercosporidium sp. MPI-PUGE-AT-0058]|nr:P-loop containing nucleoside triphosphate hydrolase protein [Rhexocercosporidium sp. MPI-PUGE-AT-0058]
MLLSDQNIDRRKCHRVVPMEVLSLGYSRTGTMSMQNAFRILGYPNPYHFSSVYGNIRDCDMWVEALRAKYDSIGTPFSRVEFDQLLGHVGAVTDAPCTLFAKELIEAYPEAKIVLVERNIEKWYKSWDSLVTGAFNPVLKVLSITDPWFIGRIQALGMTWMRTQVGAKDLDEARRNARDMYREYYAEIRRIAPKERLLEYELGSGWEPLCEFLGKQVPEVEFPHANESQSLSVMFEEMGKKGMMNSLRNIAVVGAAVAALAAWWVMK